MQSITLQSHVGNDGILRLQVPVGLKDVDVQVTLALEEAHQNGSAKSPKQDQPENTNSSKVMTIEEIEALAQSNGGPPGFFRQTAGQWAGEPLVRPPQGEFEVRDEFL